MCAQVLFFFFFLSLLLCFCNPEAKAGWGRWVCYKDEKIKTLLGLQHIEIPGEAPRLVRSRCPARAFRVSERVFRCSRCPPSSTALGSKELAKSSPLGRRRLSVRVGKILRRSGAASRSIPASVTRPRPGWGFRAKSRRVCAKELEGGKS